MTYTPPPRAWLAFVLAVLAACPPLSAQEAGDPPGFDPNRHMRISEVRQGMKGHGLSVFRGTKIERFEVEVISILRNFNPRHDVILIRCQGANLEHTGAVAGMSGSPVFLKDEQGRERMIGAFAYGWPLMKDPVAGVQPIEYMLALPTEPRKDNGAVTNQGKPAAPAVNQKVRWSLHQSTHVPWEPASAKQNPFTPSAIRARQLIGDAADAHKLRPLATPLMVSGIPQNALDLLDPVLKAHNIIALQAGAAPGGAAFFGGKDEPPSQIEPGSAIAVPMLTGDMDMTAIGTCTEVLGQRVLGFGHPFFSEGDVNLPLSSGYVHHVIANLQNSFKLGTATQLRGALHADQLVGVAGRLGDSPATIPIEIRVVYSDGSFDRTYRFKAVQHSRFTPLLSTMALLAAMSSARELPQYNTLDVDLNLEFTSDQSVRIRNRTVNANAMELFMMVGGPVQAASENPFAKVPLQKLTGTLTVQREAREAQVLSVMVPRARYQPGETIDAFVTYRPFRGAEAILPLTFQLPRDLPDGVYDFAVLDWQNHLMEEQQTRPFRFTAESAAELFSVVRDFLGVRRDALYLRLMRQPDGVAIGRTAMPRLPSSRRRVMTGAGLSNTTVFVSSTARSVPTEYVMTGRANFAITIDKAAKVETPNRPPKPETSAPAPTNPVKPDDAKPRPAAPGTPAPNKPDAPSSPSPGTPGEGQGEG